MTLAWARAARLAFALTLTVCLHAAMAHAQTEDAAEPEAPGPTAAVAPATFPKELALAREALAEHVRVRLREGGVDVRPAWELRAQLAGVDPDSAPSTCTLVEKSAANGALHVVLTDLRTTPQGIDVALRVYEPKGCKLVSAARASARGTSLGPALDGALARVLPALGGSADLLSPAALELDQLGAESRALAFLEERQLARAWRALEGSESGLSRELRERIEATAAKHDTPAVERVRLRTARGEATPNDVAARQILMEAAQSMDGEPVDARVLLAAGELRLKRGEAEDASRYLAKASALEPKNPEIWLSHGRALALLQDDPGARRAFEHAAQLEPESSRALEELAQLAANEPPRQAALLLRAGDRAARALDSRRAQESFARAMKVDPSVTAAAKEHAALLYGRFGDAEHARASWQEAIDAGGATPARLLGVAQSNRALGQIDASEIAFKKAIELDPETGSGALGLAGLYTETGRAAEARPLLEQAVELSPRDPEAKRALALVLQQSGESDAALALLRAAELTGGPTPVALRTQAAILRERGDGAGTRAALERAVELEPLDAALRTELAAAHDLLGDGASAALAREQATLLAGSAAPAALAVVPADGAGGERDLGQVDERLLALVQSFAAVEAETGQVGLVGVRESGDCWKDPLSCLSLRIPDPASLDRALARAIGAQYALLPRGELRAALANSANEALVGSLLAFGSKRSLDASAVTQVNLAIGSDALFLARVERSPRRTGEDAVSCGGDTPWRLELRQLSGRTEVGTRILGNSLCLEARGEYSRLNPRALSLFGVVALFLAFQLLRGWGSVSVAVELPPRTRALFSISLSRRARKPRATKSLKSKERAKSRIEEGLRRLNRYERALTQGTATMFSWIPARRRSYFVTVRGPLLSADTNELIGDFLEEQLVRVRRGKRTQVKFDMRPKETVVEVLVTGGDKAAGPAAIALRGVPSSLRYANEGTIFLYLKPGEYVLLVGSGDRLLERRFEIRSFDNVRLPVDLAKPQEWLFTGAAAAVDAYLEGDAPRAIDELERAGQTKVASKLRAQILRAKGELDAAAREFETGGDLHAAAELKVESQDTHGAATLFEGAGDFDEAATAYRAAGDLPAAARAYERAGDLASAIECAKEAGDDEYLLALYEKNGDSFEAGELAVKARQTIRAIHAFELVDRIDGNYRVACRRLVELYMERSQLRPALEKLEALVELEGGEDAPLPLRSVQARLLEKLGQGEQALALWEAIEARDPSFQDASARVAALRAKHRAPEPAPVAEAPAEAAESRYEILEELGCGAMGVVYKARDKRLGRIVALKRLTDNLRGHTTAIAYFEREARSAAALSHPNIVVVYDAGQENGHYFITMEHLSGTTLEQILQARGAMSTSVVASIGIQICAGLHYAHANKIIHRDIKTANLFFTRERIVKIMDFGLAKMVEEVRRGATMISGTPYYMAPEQARGENVDHRADLYALGVTLFNLLTNGFPFESGDVTFHHRNTPAPDVRDRVPEIPEAMAALVSKLMAKAPEERCQSAAEVAHELQQIAVAATRANPG